MTLLAEPAEARRRNRGGGYNPPYSDLVMDAKTGQILHATAPDAPRIPASITKVMTLYLVFEQLEAGKLRMDSELTVSANAARQAPSKIGFDAGDTISVEDAIMAVITKSANDVAMTIAENLGGSQEGFARLMNAKARALGMTHTVYYNPHGLPHSPSNMTTARDLATLARAIQERFPRYYPLFSKRSHDYAGTVLRNHNRLLGRVEGVDGIKTGYTRASGFNLMTSARSEGRHIVAIVLGGRSGASRDRIMADLVEENLPRAAIGPRTTQVAEAPAAAPIPAPAPAPQPVASAAPVAPPAAERVEKARPAVVAEAKAPAPPIRTAAARATPLDLSATRPVAAGVTTPTAMRWAAGAPPRRNDGALRPPANVDVTSSITRVAEPEPTSHTLAYAAAETPRGSANPVTSVAKQAPAPAAHQAAAAPKAEVAATGWVIQLGATDDEGKARDILARAKSKAGAPLRTAAPVIGTVEKGGAKLYRARFAGFDDSAGAEAACKALKRDGFACFAIKG